jgi:hypothetical protein
MAAGALLGAQQGGGSQKSHQRRREASGLISACALRKWFLRPLSAVPVRRILHPLQTPLARAGGRVGEMVRSGDVFPTVLYREIKSPDFDFFSSNLFRPMRAWEKHPPTSSSPPEEGAEPAISGTGRGFAQEGRGCGLGIAGRPRILMKMPLPSTLSSSTTFVAGEGALGPLLAVIQSFPWLATAMLVRCGGSAPPVSSSAASRRCPPSSPEALQSGRTQSPPAITPPGPPAILGVVVSESTRRQFVRITARGDMATFGEISPTLL